MIDDHQCNFGGCKRFIFARVVLNVEQTDNFQCDSDGWGS